MGPRTTPRLALLWVALLGFALRFVWLVVAHPSPVADHAGYKALGRRLLEDGTFIRHGDPTAYRTPGYPGFLASATWISDSDFWLSLSNVLVATTVIPLVWLFARRLGLSNRTALLAAAVAAVTPPLVLWAPVLASENLQIVLLLVSFVLVLASQRSWISLTGAGLALGAAVLVRPESLFYIAAIPVLFWVMRERCRRGLAKTAAIVCIVGLVVAPWFVRNNVEVGPGTGLSSTAGVNFYMAHRDTGYGFIAESRTPLADLSEAEMNRKGFDLGLGYLASEPASVVGTAFQGTVALYEPPVDAVFWSTRASHVRGPYPSGVSPAVSAIGWVYAVAGWLLVVAIAGVGCSRLWRKQRRALAALGALVAANWLCFTVIFWAMSRYRLAVEPIVAIAAGAGLEVLWSRYRQRTKRVETAPGEEVPRSDRSLVGV